MYTLFLNSPFTDQFINALCWTFIHSLWQGLVFALLTASIIQLTKRSGSVLRYHLLSALFLLFVVIAMVTFSREFKSPYLTITSTPGVKAGVPMHAESTVSGNNMTNNSNQNQLSLVAKFTNYLNTHAQVIVLLWFVLFCAKSLQMLLNIVYIQRVKFYKTQIPSIQWIDKIKILSGRLGIKRMVVLLESGIIKVPVVVGFFKPVLLLPLGLLSNLPSDEIEAILLHELAHIQRKDYLINLVQCFIEDVFFFNPALLWISSLIKEERENCCDDIAITLTNNKAKYIQALISFQEYNNTSLAYGMAFGAAKSHLLNRVKRIILNKNKTLNSMEKTLFAGSIAAIVFLSFGPVKRLFSLPVAQNEVKEAGFFHTMKSVNATNQPFSTTTHINNTITKGEKTLRMTDTLPTPSASQPPKAIPDAPQNEFSNFFSSINRKGSNTILWMEATGADGKTYKINKINNTISALYIDGVKIDDEHINDYSGIISKMENEIAKHTNEAPNDYGKPNDEIQRKLRKKITEEKENQIKDIDFAKINQEIKEALARVDIQKITNEADKALKNVDWNKIKINVELALKEAQIQIKNIDTEKIRKQIEQSQEKIKKENWNIKIDKEKINKEVEEALRNARQQIEKARSQNYKMDKQVEDGLRLDRQKMDQQFEPE